MGAETVDDMSSRVVLANTGRGRRSNHRE